jgi:hypothetical protein
LHLADKLIVRAVKAQAGDFRDWPAIKAWANKIVEQLAVPQPGV